MSVKLDKPSTRWIWISVGTAAVLSITASTIALHTESPEGIPLMNYSFMVTMIVWFGALTYTAVWWVRRFIAKAIEDLEIKDVDRWRRMAAEAEPHLKPVPRGDTVGWN